MYSFSIVTSWLQVKRCLGLLDAQNVLVGASLAGMDGGDRRRRDDASREVGSAAVANSRNLTFDLLLSLIHAGEWYLPAKMLSEIPASVILYPTNCTRAAVENTSNFRMIDAVLDVEPYSCISHHAL